MLATDRDTLMREGWHAFNRAEFFLAHEVWENVWKVAVGPERRWLQGLIQIAAGLHKLSTGATQPAARLLDKALVKLVDAPSPLYDFDVDALRRDVTRMLGDLHTRKATAAITIGRLALAACFVFGLGCRTPPPIDGRSAYAVDSEPAGAQWLRSALDVAAASYMPVPDFGKLSPQVRGDSMYWSERFFSAKANPFARKPEPIISLHTSKGRSPDLIAYQYRLDKLELSVIESVNFTVVLVRGSGVVETPASDRPAVVASVAATVLNMKDDQHEWMFGPFVQHGADIEFSTNATIDPWAMESWRDRADGGIRGGTIYFLLFKKNRSYVGYHNAQDWFDAELRAKYKSWY